MSNTDDLEEFDAELEIALKKEYSTVFPLFRYCVVTQEATYLCNRLVMDCVPNASYLLFEIRMDDVWVWDRNRPTRIIPRAQIYTTSDVSVEQLKDDVTEEEFLEAVPANVVEQLRLLALGEAEELEDPEIELEGESVDADAAGDAGDESHG